MMIARPIIPAAALVATLGGAPGAAAQTVPLQQVQMVPRPTPDADALADAMRRIGANPRDLASLIQAGELSLKLGDVNAAASLLKRAENVDPMNGRVKAGMARILVTQERPGEALRYFDQAVGYGLNPASFAGDRGLAYDLIGEQERAQRDYRVALKGAGGDEVRRRYALSLGISGKRKEALAEIDDQVRRNDRSAWRIRAFILAMTGDVPGAEKIAATMMPPGMGAALAPFFARLPSLPAADRAFAVHFGELRPTPQRLADARMVPPLPALAPEASVLVQVAAAAPAAQRAPDARTSRTQARAEARRQRELARAEQRARRSRSTARPPVAVASVAPTPAVSEALQPPRYGGGVTFAAPRAVVQSVPTQPVAPQAVPAQSLTVAAISSAVTSPAPASGVPTATTSIAPATQLAAATPTRAPSAPLTQAPAPVAQAPAPVLQSPAVQPGFASLTPAASTPALAASATARTPAAATPAPAAVEPATPVSPTLSEDTILARIMAGISIPGSELGVAPVRPPEPTPEPAPAPGTSIATPASIASADAAKRAANAEAAAQQARADDKPAAKPAEKPPVKKAEPKKPDTKVAEKEEPKVDPKKAAADRKAAAAKKLADAKKAEEAKKAADEARIAKANPARIWVQVAGGANKDDLPKAWAAAQGKADALKGKSAYTTPLRFTNRVVTGPFKTDAEAREFINTLAKQGVSAFAFTSDKGQKMERLPVK